MAQEHHQPSWADEARQDALSSPELVERILAQLETPLLILGSKAEHPSGTKRMEGDRWTASQVGRTFRAAALRLPWQAELVDSDTGAVGPGAAALCLGRTVTHLLMTLSEQTPAAEAALLFCGPSLVSLEVSLYDFPTWLNTTQLPVQAAAAEGLVKCVPLLTYLSSFSQLKVLKVTSTRAWQGASWLTALPQLEHVHLRHFAGAPVGGLPHLISLGVEYTHPAPGVPTEGVRPQVALEQWASLRLTHLCLVSHAVLLGSPLQTPSAQAWLRGLQSLELVDCHMKVHPLRWRETVPCLTRLVVSYRQDSTDCIDGFLAGGLPLGLVHLQLEQCAMSAPEQPWVALQGMTRLEYMIVTRTGMFVGVKEACLAIAALSAMPKLMHALLVLTTNDVEALGERFSGLEAQMAARGALLNVGYIAREDLGPDGDSVPSDEDPFYYADEDSEAEPLLYDEED